MAAQALQTLVGIPAVQAPLTIAGTLGALLFDMLPPAAQAAQAHNLTLHCTLPENFTINGINVSPPINPSFPGFAFEQASFYNYSFAEDGSPNTFSQNLIDSIMSRTGGAPYIRVGGTSGDHAHYDPSLSVACSAPASQGPPRFRRPYLVVGPSYWKAFQNFPGARYIFMVPLAQRNLNSTLQWAAQGLAAIGDNLEALEIGNEPDLYRWFTVDAYVKEFNRFATALAKQFPDQLGGIIFQALDTASKKSGPKHKLGAVEAFEAGMNTTGQIKQIGYHLYQKVDRRDDSYEKLQRDLANHTAISQEMSQFIPYIDFLQANAPGTPFILSEVGNSLGNRSLMTRNVFATTLWNLDYQLHALSIGVNLVNNQQIVWPGFQMWEPVQTRMSPPVVRANYYSQPFLADFISNATSSRRVETRVIELNMDSDLMSAYAAYDDGKLSRLAIVNMNLWSYQNGNRGQMSYRISGLGDTSSATITDLTSPQGMYDMNNITYGGLQWTYESQGKQVQVGPRPGTSPVTNGQLFVSVPATSAVLIDFNDG